MNSQTSREYVSCIGLAVYMGVVTPWGLGGAVVCSPAPLSTALFSDRLTPSAQG